jgi:hypothetical protein
MDEMYGLLADTLQAAEHSMDDVQWENAEALDAEEGGGSPCVLAMLNGEPVRIMMERI